MKLLDIKPPVWNKLVNQFGVSWGTTIVAYYPNVYCAKNIPEAKMVHEQIHLSRQKEMGVTLWWDLYLSNPSFRLEEEVIAYKAEIEYLRDTFDRNTRKLFCNQIYKDLSSYIYGSLITEDEAKRLLS